jgi:NYN domain
VPGMSKVRQLPRPASTSRWRFPERTLHVVDIENLAGTAIPTLLEVNKVQRLYLARLGFGADDQVVMAASHMCLVNAALGWPHARYRVRSGRDGADLELMDVLLHEDVASRFRHVVIGSGDGMFRAAAESLTSRNVRVTVASRPGSLSYYLRRAATDIVYLDVPGVVAALGACGGAGPCPTPHDELSSLR